MRVWGGRFGEANDERVAAFTRSIEVDRELAADDVAGSIAHVRGLCERACDAQVRPAPRGEAEPRTLGGEGAGDGRADASAGPGDEGDAPIEQAHQATSQRSTMDDQW